MARQIISSSRFSGGLSYGEKEGLNSSFLWAKSMDYRSDPGTLKILPKTAKVSGTVVKDLIMDGDRQSTDAYFYGDAGHIYKRDTSEVWTDLTTVPDSHGNGMKYFGEDLYLYYTSDTVIGRYGPFGGTKTFAHDFLGAQGGVPLNTHSLDMEATSSMYATAADDATLSITGDITLEGCFKIESLPAVGAQMVLMSKWDELSDERSYKFDIAGVSARFGDGALGALTIDANTTQSLTDAACTGTAAAYTLSATAAFVTGDKILIHKSRGTGAGKWEENEIASYTAGTITLANALKNTYTAQSQVIVFPEYTNVTVNSAKIWTAKAWNGTVGGILLFKASGTVTITGNISANTRGFRGSDGVLDPNASGNPGESASGFEGTAATGAGQNNGVNPGAGGGYGTAGTGGQNNQTPGSVYGVADLTQFTFGGGGAGASANPASNAGDGGNSGGAIFFYGATIAAITGSVTATGENGEYGTDRSGGGGSGGAILIKAQTATLGTNKITAAGGTGGQNPGDLGGNGGVGRIHLDYYTSYTGTTTPTLDVTQDDTLVTSTVYQLRFSVSTAGTAATTETLAKELPATPTLSQWYRYAVKWDASAKQANFFVGGVDIGQATGSKTSIYDSTALFAIGASFNSAGAAEKFFDGKGDDFRVYNDLRTDSELNTFKEVELGGGEQGLVAYHKVNNSTADSSANSNTLTLVNSPTYDADDVPFSSPTTRHDLDQSLDTSGNTYTLAVAIDEGATHRQSFVPAKDPQKSIEVLVADAGSGDWTCTVHDGLNREVASATIVNASVIVGDNEFIFSTPWRPHIGATYHFHLTSTVADGTVTTTTTVDLETVDFHTYYQFLVDDDFHPIEHHAEKLCIANERYLATWDGSTYTPHKLTLPSGYRIRALGIWREYLVMGVQLGTNIEDYDFGYLFFWDGNHDTYNFYVPVPQGGINAIQSGDPIHFIAGYSGDFMKYEGGKAYKIRRLPKVETSVMEINPKALAMWRALVRIGLAEDCSSTTLERGVYSYGSLHEELVDTLSFDYPLSLGITTGAELEIGMLFPIGSSLFISWRSGSTYGVDSVTPTNDPYSTARIEFLISDSDKIWAEKQAHVIRSYFKPLVSGDSVQLEYKLDRASSWTEGDAETTADKKEVRLSLPTKGGRHNEFQVAIDLETTGSATPEIYGWAIEVDDLQRERRT